MDSNLYFFSVVVYEQQQYIYLHIEVNPWLTSIIDSDVSLQETSEMQYFASVHMHKRKHYSLFFLSNVKRFMYAKCFASPLVWDFDIPGNREWVKVVNSDFKMKNEKKIVCGKNNMSKGMKPKSKVPPCYLRSREKKKWKWNSRRKGRNSGQSIL